MNLRFFLMIFSVIPLAACSVANLSYSPAPGIHLSVPFHLPSDRHARLPGGHGGHYKTGKPYHVGGRSYFPLSTASGYDKTGIASWYGRDFHGKLTANGERYDMHALSAAHKTLPLPSLVRVTNLENGRSVVVRVNDRGPFAKHRLIDMSWAAARALGYAAKGTARVRVQALDTAAPAVVGAGMARIAPRHAASPSTQASLTSGMFVQIGAFSIRNNATKLSASLASRYPNIRVQSFARSTQTLYRVRVGPFSSAHAIEQTVLSLQRQGYGNTVVVIE